MEYFIIDIDLKRWYFYGFNHSINNNKQYKFLCFTIKFLKRIR